MLANHEYPGLWWLPGSEAKKLTATLVIERGTSELEALGNFGHELLSESPRERAYSLDPSDQDRVLGTSTDGKSITLQGLSSLGSTVSMPGIPTSKYGAEAALVGKHFPAGEEIAFDEVSIRVTDLNAWTQVNGFDFNMDFESLDDKGTLGFSAVNIRYEGPEPLSIPLSRGEEISVQFTASNQGLGPGSDHVELRQEAALHLRFARKASLEKVYLRVGQVRNFLSLAVGRPVSVISVSGYQGNHPRDGVDRRQPVELFWPIAHNPKAPSRRRLGREMLFTLPEAEPDISTVMKKWFQRQERLKPVFNLFFGTLYNPSLYLEVKFLAYAQAIETYDYRRRRKPGVKTLAERVRDVLGQCATVTKRIVGPDQQDITRFIDEFKNTRNYYTHYNPKLEKKAASGTALLLLTIQLQAIIEMSLLRQLGFPSRGVDRILQRAGRYHQISRFRSLASTEDQEQQQETNPPD